MPEEERRVVRSVADLLNSPVEDLPCWLNPMVLPKGGSLLFGGLSKIGKSWIMNSMIRSLITKENLYGQVNLQVPEKCRVLMVEAELGEASLKKRLSLSLDNIPQEVYRESLYYVSKVPELSLDRLTGLDMLKGFIDDCQPNIVFLDPIGRFHAAEENDRGEIAKLLSNLDKLKACYPNLSLVLSHHFGKPPRENYDPLDKYNFRGSSVWVDYSDTLVTVARGPNLEGRNDAWRINMRYTMRHGEEIPDTATEFNRFRDGLVRVINVEGQDEALPARNLPGFRRTR